METMTLLVLLFTVFAVPGACFCIMLGFYLRGVWLGYKTRRYYRRTYASWGSSW